MKKVIFKNQNSLYYIDNKFFFLMCGILGSINHHMDLDDTRSLLYHRGPDEQDLFSHENVIFHHFRLSILDIKGGKQPMKHNHLIVIFNGELYNHLEVRKKYDLKCNTQSDTETLLAAYEKLGPKCLNDFDGMFALAILDTKSRNIFLARDRAGKKPLYVYNNARKIIFSSELNALKGLVKLEPNHSVINDFICNGAFIGSSTPFNHITELEGGQYALINIDNCEIEVNTWWNINSFYHKRSHYNFEESKQIVLKSLMDGVKRRLDSSDLEVGAFLSGGIDSSLIVALAAQHKEKIKTFTVSMPGSYDEAPLAKLVADKYATEHTEIKINFDHLKNDFESIVSNYGEPFKDSSAIPSYYVSQAAKEHITVVLNGDGADELFAGYRRYVLVSKWDIYKKSTFKNLTSKSLLSLLPIAHEKKSTYNYFYRLLKIAASDPSDIYWTTTIDSFSGVNGTGLRVSEQSSFISDFLKKNKNLSGLQKQMNLDFEILLKGILLKKMDIATMAHSLEGRSPFLCKELLEIAPTINDSYKIKGTRTKHILRSISEDLLPDELVNQPKRGFEIPLKNWLDNQLSEHVNDYLRSTNAQYVNYISPSFVTKLLDKKIKVSDEKRAKMLYALLVTEIWFKNLS